MLIQWVKIGINTEALLHASKEVSLEIDMDKTKYMVISHHQNAGQNHNIRGS